MRPESFLRFPRFHDVTREDLNVELQVHTDQTDGEASVDALLATARERGLAVIAFTEHVRESTDWFAEFAERVRGASRRFPELRVAVGCEAKALDSSGGFDCSEGVLRSCDIVLGSVHRLPDGRGGYLRFEELEPEELLEREFEYSLGLMRSAPIHVLAHPGGMYQRHVGRYPERLLRTMMETSVETGVAIEINTSYLRDLESFLRVCDQVNPYISIGSDVHTLDQVGKCRDVLLETGRFAA